MENQDFYNNIINKAHKINIDLEEDQIYKLYIYMNLLLEWNEKINLTTIIEPDDIILKHFIDSITVNKYLKNARNVIDIGTGAGFPGIPLKIINNKVKFTLVDSLNKRISFLKEIVEQLCLRDIEIVHSRAEDLARSVAYREKYDIVTSRAVAKLPILLEYMMPFAKIGGKCICMKASNIDEELREAHKAIEQLGGKVLKIDTFKLPDIDIERNIVIIEKVKQTPEKYPRKAGIPSKQPII